jgi:glycosyltransferase involved in cell wall biosynthesis
VIKSFGNHKLKKIKKKYDDIAFIYCPMVSYWSSHINKKLGYKYYVVNHDPIPHSGEKFIFKIYDFVFNKNKIFSNAEAIIVHSQTFMQYVKEKFNKKVYYMPLGEHSAYQRDQNVLTSIYSPNKINFLFFGRITKYKGLDILYKAFVIIADRYPKRSSLTIVGEGDYKQFIGENFENYPIELINRWIPDDEVFRYFTGENIVMVCPYIDATQSGVILVAFDFGIPVIVTKTGGLVEQVDNEKNAILIEPGNVEELVKSMEKFIFDPRLIYQMKENIAKSAPTPSWAEVIKNLLYQIGNEKITVNNSKI